MRPLLALGLLFLLAGCWTGAPFYSATDARTGIPPGDYLGSRTAMPGEAESETQGPVRIAVRPDGMTQVTDPDARANNPILTLGFAPLGGSDPAHMVAWIVQYDNRELSGAQNAYGILIPGPGGRYRLLLPGCGDTQEAAAVAAGAQVERAAHGVKLCRFADREALLTALRRVAASPPEGLMVLTFRPR